MTSLRSLVSGDEAVLATVVFNPLMARIATAAGFPALYLGGGTLGYVKTVLEANLNLTEMTQLGIEIRAAVDAPLILDAAYGWSDPMHIHRAITTAQAAGFAAIEIEDQIIPKRAHHHIGVEHMIPLELMADKLREAVAARRDPEILIVGRTNAIRASNMDDALRRAEAYKKTGVDLLMLAPRTVEEFEILAARLEPPFMFNLPPGGLKRLGLALADVAGLGCRILIDPARPLLAAYRAWKACYEATISDTNWDDMTPEEMEAIQADMFADIGMSAMIDIEKATVEK